MIATDTNNENVIPMYGRHPSSDGFKKIIDHELGHAIGEAIIRMPLDYRVVFSLRELNGMSAADTAESLEISEANVKIRLNRARQMLKKDLGNLYSLQDIFEFNLVYCDGMVNRVMRELDNSEGYLF